MCRWKSPKDVEIKYPGETTAMYHLLTWFPQPLSDIYRRWKDSNLWQITSQPFKHHQIFCLLKSITRMLILQGFCKFGGHLTLGQDYAYIDMDVRTPVDKTYYFSRVSYPQLLNELRQLLHMLCPPIKRFSSLLQIFVPLIDLGYLTWDSVIQHLLDNPRHNTYILHPR